MNTVIEGTSENKETTISVGEDQAGDCYSVSDEIDERVISCLMGYWIKQGLTRDHAEMAARNALVKIKAKANCGTWCLSPDV